MGIIVYSYQLITKTPLSLLHYTGAYVNLWGKFGLLGSHDLCVHTTVALSFSIRQQGQDVTSNHPAMCIYPLYDEDAFHILCFTGKGGFQNIHVFIE